MNEIWRKIEGFEKYEVSNLGRVRSLNYRKTKETKILKLCKDKYGYLRVGLSKDGKMYNKSIHRLVATAFISNPGEKEQVNHIDGNKQNNVVKNLEWCSNTENQRHAWRTGLKNEETKKKISKTLKGKMTGEKNPMYGMSGDKSPSSRKVICTTTGEIFDCIKDAGEKYNIDRSNISKCCKGKMKSAGKLVWRYWEE